MSELSGFDAAKKALENTRNLKSKFSDNNIIQVISNEVVCLLFYRLLWLFSLQNEVKMRFIQQSFYYLFPAYNYNTQYF
jgi:hypothetical protein